jgi:hypothetical protein
VVFIGGSRDALAAVQASLPSAAKVLAGSGVLVPRAGRTGSKAAGFSHQSLAVPTEPAWGDLYAEVETAGSQSMLLVIPGMMRLGRSDSRRPQIVKRLTSLADEVLVVSVVGDQLTAINDAYLGQVSTWRTSKRLEALLPRLLESDIFDHEAMLRPWYDDPDVTYVGLPLVDFDLADPLLAVLRATGSEVTRARPASEVTVPPKLGPVGVEANRLLATYVRAQVTGFDPADPRNVPLSRAALNRADKLGWCAEPFWGWTRRPAERALTRFDASNRRFAQRVWGTAWTQPYPLERPSTRVEFLDLDVAAVDQVQRYVVGMTGRIKRERKKR